MPVRIAVLGRGSRETSGWGALVLGAFNLFLSLQPDPEMVGKGVAVPIAHE